MGSGLFCEFFFSVDICILVFCVLFLFCYNIIVFFILSLLFVICLGFWSVLCFISFHFLALLFICWLILLFTIVACLWYFWWLFGLIILVFCFLLSISDSFSELLFVGLLSSSSEYSSVISGWPVHIF